MGGQSGANCDSLSLTGRKPGRIAITQVSNTEQVKDFFNAGAHYRRLGSLLFHGVGQFVNNAVGDETGGRVLAHVADQSSQTPWRMSAGGAAANCHPA
jgi:hypothetical protein